MKLMREFYLRDSVVLAQSLLGKILVHESDEGITSGIIVETEAYRGPEDKAAHTYNNRRTNRTEIIFGEGGFAYIYLVYGMHYCFNVTANISGNPECVLVRAIEPLEGLDLMKSRRKTADILNLTNGPGKLCSAMGITRELYGEDLCGERLYILDNDYPGIEITASTRIGISYAEEHRDFLWRFYISGNKYVSKN